MGMNEDIERIRAVISKPEQVEWIKIAADDLARSADKVLTNDGLNNNEMFVNLASLAYAAHHMVTALKVAGMDGTGDGEALLETMVKVMRIKLERVDMAVKELKRAIESEDPFENDEN